VVANNNKVKKTHLFAGSLQCRKRLEDTIDKSAVRISYALLQAEQRLEMRIREEQLTVGNQLGRLAQLSCHRMDEISYETSAAVLCLTKMVGNNSSGQRLDHIGGWWDRGMRTGAKSTINGITGGTGVRTLVDGRAALTTTGRC